jgi:hypothetical protein
MLDGEEELRAFLGVAPDYAGLRVIFDRRDKNMVRNVYVLDERVLIKTFTEHPGKRDRRTPWVREHNALQWLMGLPVPASLGCDTVRRRDGRAMFVLRKEYLPGEPLETLNARSIRQFAELMGGIHARGVVANDPARANVLQGNDGRLAVLDFGKARLFRWKTPRFWWYIGKEHCLVLKSFCKGDARAFGEYHVHYLESRDAPVGWRRALMRSGFVRYCRRRGVATPVLPWD